MKSNYHHHYLRCLVALVAMVALAGSASAQQAYSYTSGTYTQNFDNVPYNTTSGTDVVPVPSPVIDGTTYTLPAAGTAYDLSTALTSSGTISSLVGWFAVGPLKNVYGANGGSTSTGGIYSYGATGTSGAALDRSLGMVSTTTTGASEVGLLLFNNSGTNYSQFSLSYSAEQWRQSTTAKTLTFGYSVEGSGSLTALPTSGLTSVSSLNSGSFATGAAQTTDGSAPVAVNGVSATNVALSSIWANGTYLWLTWNVAAGSNGQGIGIDNLSFAAFAASINAAWNVGSGSWTIGSGTNWTGATGTVYTEGDSVTFANAAGGTISLGANVAPGNIAVSATSGTYAFTGAGSINGTGSLTKSGSGTLDLTGLSNGNGYSGGTVLSGGRINISNDNQLGSAAGALSIDNAATLSITSSISSISSTRALTTGTGGATIATNGNNFSTTGSPTINGVLTTTGSGNVSLGGSSLTFGASGSLNIGSGGSLTIAGSASTITMSNGGTFDGDLILNTSARINLDGAGLTYGGAGKIYLLGSSMGAGNGGSTITSGSFGNTNLLISNLSGTPGGTITSNIVLNPANAGPLSGHVAFTAGDLSGANYKTASFLAFIGATTGGQTLTIGDSSHTNGIISGEGDLFIGNQSKIGGGAGNLILNAANTYTGNTLINNGGTIILGTANALPTTTSVIFGSLSGAGNAILDLNGNNQQIISLSDDAAKPSGKNLTIVNNGSADAILAVNGSITPANAFGGSIADGLFKVGLEKSGVGTLVLSGNNTYTGDTTVSGGALAVNGSLGNTAVTVNGGTLSGTGTISGLITVANGGNVNPGNSPGILNAAGGFDLLAGGTLTIEMTLSGTVPGTNYDQVNVTGGVSLAGDLVLSLSSYTHVENSLFFIISNDLADAVSGTFTGLAQDAIFSSGGNDFQISYTADATAGTLTGGNDVALMAVPEPGTFALAGLGLAGALWRLRRRPGGTRSVVSLE